MNKLRKSDRKYMEVLYCIWLLLTYYANLFGLDVPESANKLIATLFYDGNLTKIRIVLPRLHEVDTSYSVLEMRSIMNDYLPILLQDSSLEPFAAGNSYHEIVAALYVSIVVGSNSYFDMDFLYVDNLDAYKIVTENRMDNILRIL